MKWCISKPTGYSEGPLQNKVCNLQYLPCSTNYLLKDYLGVVSMRLVLRVSLSAYVLGQRKLWVEGITLFPFVTSCGS